MRESFGFVFSAGGGGAAGFGVWSALQAAGLPDAVAGRFGAVAGVSLLFILLAITTWPSARKD